ncbi:MAG: carboxypeptidase M32 [Methyloceanibacter sp.]|uniref:carboxypeptidase M32 n=1 Tax=Methyloceanibacter sp. TaxID=1965321 RepID=UPI003D6CD268
MRPILSPAEALGLSGATLEARIRRAANHVSDATFARIAERLRADAIANEMIYEHEGVQEPVRLMLRPLLVMQEQLSYVHHVCLQLIEALKRLPDLYLQDETIRRIVAVTPDEERWVRETWTKDHSRVNSIYGRLDAVCDFTGAGWQESLHFMEPNLTGVGGIHYAPVAEQMVMRDIVPTLLAHDPGLVVELPRDQRELFVQVLIDHARAIGRESCQLCFVEPKYVHEGPAEQSVLSEFLSRQHGLTIAHADPRELRVAGEEVFYEDVRIDVAYRDYELRELIALEKEIGRPLDAMRLLFRQNRVVSSLVGDFDHKSAFEILTDPVLGERYFGADDRRLFRRHVLWTRLLADRRTTLPHDKDGDLLDYARGNRELLVLKPNRAYGGTGVMLGAATGQGEWEKALNDAVLNADDPEQSWVVQTAARLPVHEFPIVGANGRVFGEPFYAVMGFAATENGLGTVCRVSQKQVVNVAQRGGLAAVLEAEVPAELRIPKRPASRSKDAEQALRAQISELLHLDQTIALLGWDEETMLPPAGRAERGGQLATLEGIRHALLVSDRLGDLVEEVAAQSEGNERLTRELYLLRRLRRQALALPEDLVRHFANARSLALGAWEEARVRDFYAVFAPSFERLVALVRERAQALAGGGDAYDALLDEHEPGMSGSRLDLVLDEVRNALVPLVRGANPPPDGTLHGRTFATAAQWELSRQFLTAMGFAFERGRLDRSTHPFSLLAGNDDVRLTIRVDESDISEAVLAALHEGGHGLYDQGFDPVDRDTLLAEAPSMGMQECQARLWENHVGRSRAFWEYALPSLQKLFPQAVDGLDAEPFYRSVNLVRPGAIRVAADEVSYHLHIVLRYELEIALISGALGVGDLPQAWNERSTSLIGATPASDREGVLQDVHWSLGMFGYFPTYTLGSLYAAQLAEAYAREHPLADEIRRGEFGGLLGWLRTNIHRVGQRLSAEQIMEKATGKRLDTGSFFRHLAAKHLS